MQCPLAGFQFHCGESCWPRMRAGDALALQREPGNRHDARAIAVHWQGVMLGYVPREANYAISQMLDRGCRIEARVASLRAGGDPWSRVMMEVVWVFTPGRGDPVAQANEKRAFASTPVLVRSLANRIFGAAPPPKMLEWVGERAEAIALVGVEHPALLPFLRIVAADAFASVEPQPVAALKALLDAARIEPGAWRRLCRWGLASFASLGAAFLDPVAVARYANFLLHLGLEAPPADLAAAVLAMARYRAPPSAFLDLERQPMWFMRAYAEALEEGVTTAQLVALPHEVRCCLDWLIDASPRPDANQQHAGWPWILARAREHRKARELAAAVPWSVPMGEMRIDDWRVVPLRNPAEVVAEAKAMRNCLEDYVDDFGSGNFAVYSIRDGRSGKPLACFSVGRESPRHAWEVEQVAGPGNAEPTEELYAVAAVALGKLRSAAASPASRP